METLYNEVKGQRCMLTSIVNQYLLSNKPNIPDRRPSYKSMKSVGTSSQEMLDGAFLCFFEGSLYIGFIVIDFVDIEESFYSLLIMQ